MKEEKANDQIMFSMIQDISALFNGEDFRNSASTASIAESDIQRDGADKSDIQHILENNVFDKFGDIPGKILHNLQEYPEILKELSENYDPEEVQDIVDNMSSDPDALYAFGEMLTDYLQNIKQTVDYKHWLFGHMHVNQTYHWERSTCLYEQIIRIL